MPPLPMRHFLSAPLHSPRIVAALTTVVGLGALGISNAQAEPAPPAPSPAPTSAADAPKPGPVPEWRVDLSHSSLLFRIRHADVTPFYGNFKEFSGDIAFDPARPEAASFVFEVKADSIDTRQADRDKHLRNPDFFNAKQFPLIRFRSTSMAPTGKPGRYTLNGDLTLLGITKPISAKLHFVGFGKNNKGAEVAGFEARFTFRRSEFGMTYGLGKTLGDEVDVIVAVEALRK